MTPARPPLVIVAGPPASGKSTLARSIARALGLPVISKDLIKEAIGGRIDAGAQGVGEASFAVQFAVAGELLRSGNGLVLEGAFFRNQDEIVEIAALGETVVVEVAARIEVLEKRYADRVGQRHKAHRGLEALPDLRDRVSKDAYGAPQLGCPVLRVDTTDGLTPSESEILVWIRSRLRLRG